MVAIFGTLEVGSGSSKVAEEVDVDRRHCKIILIGAKVERI